MRNAFVSILFLLFFVISPSISFGQTVASADLKSEMIGAWSMDIEGDSLRKLDITKVDQVTTEKIIFSAGAGFACFGIPEEMKVELDTRSQILTLITVRTGAKRIFSQLPNATFIGAMDRGGVSIKITIAKLSPDAKVGCSREIITATVPFMSGVFFKEQKQVPVRGFLWVPNDGKAT